MGSIVKGKDATLYWGYHVAGTVKDWTATKSSPVEPGNITGTVVDVDTFRASQHPIVFVVKHANGEWRWTLTELQITDATFTAKTAP